MAAFFFLKNSVKCKHTIISVTAIIPSLSKISPFSVFHIYTQDTLTRWMCRASLCNDSLNGKQNWLSGECDGQAGHYRVTQ